MKSKTIISLLIIILLLPTIVYSVEKQETTYQINDNHVIVNHQIKTENKEKILLDTPSDSWEYTVTENQKAKNFDLKSVNNRKELTVNTTRSSNLNIEYKTVKHLESGDNNYFTTSIKYNYNIQNLSTKVILPEGLNLARSLNSINPPVSPEPNQVSTNGRQIVIEWKNEQVKKEDNIPIFIAYEKNNSILTYTTPVILALLLIIATIITYYYSKKFKNKISSEDRFLHLTDSEEKIIKTLEKAEDNIMWQKQLQKETSFTKSKLSRKLKEMEERELIEKINYGKSNKIKLTENYQEILS